MCETGVSDDVMTDTAVAVLIFRSLGGGTVSELLGLCWRCFPPSENSSQS